MGKKIGVVTGQEVKTYKGVENTRVLQVALYGNNPESVVWISDPGEDTAPVNGDYVVVREIADDKYTMGVKDILPLVSGPGEKRIYSRDSAGVLLASIYLNSSNEIIIESLDQSIVFDLLKHTHLGNLGFDTLPPTITGSEVAAPSQLPSTNDDGDIIDGSGTNLSTHHHTQPNDGDGDVEEPTSGPVN